jgi:hypothetical protein
MRGRIALPKHFVRNQRAAFVPFLQTFRSAARPRVALSFPILRIEICL